MKCPHGVDADRVLCHDCYPAPRHFVGVQPPTTHDHAPTFVDGSGVSVTEVFNGFIIRFSAPTVEELMRLKREYYDKKGK